MEFDVAMLITTLLLLKFLFSSCLTGWPHSRKLTIFFPSYVLKYSDKSDILLIHLSYFTVNHCTLLKFLKHSLFLIDVIFIIWHYCSNLSIIKTKHKITNVECISWKVQSSTEILAFPTVQVYTPIISPSWLSFLLEWTLGHCLENKETCLI